MTTKTVSESKATEPHSALPWRVEEGYWANEGHIFIEADDTLNHFKQHILRLGYAFDRQGNDLRKENAEFICCAVNNHSRLVGIVKQFVKMVREENLIAGHGRRETGTKLYQDACSALMEVESKQ